MDDLDIIVDGRHLRFVYDDALAGLLELGRADVRRASHVEPTTDGRWAADMSPALALPGFRPSAADGCAGPRVILGPFRLRGDALAAERAWLKDHGF